MSIVRRFLLHTFEGNQDKNVHTVKVQPGSEFLQAKVLHDGIHVFYKCTSLVTDFTEEETFIVVKPEKTEIPEGFSFVEVLDTIIEIPPVGNEEASQGIVLFPLFKKDKDVSTKNKARTK